MFVLQYSYLDINQIFLSEDTFIINTRLLLLALLLFNFESTSYINCQDFQKSLEVSKTKQSWSKTT